MILSVANFFIKRPVFATVCSIIVTLLGLAAIPTLPVAQYPNITPPQVSVNANYVGANAEVVETTVTNILERELNGLEGVRYVKSTSANDGTSNINLTFDLGSDQDLAAVDVQNRVSSVLSRLPGPVTQTGVRVNKSNSNFLLAIGLYAEADEAGQDRYDDVYLSNYADLYLVDSLRRIQGVDDVRIFGERKYAMRVWLDPNRLASRSLTPQDVVAALQAQNLQVGAGQVGQPPVDANQQYQYSVTALGRLEDAAEFNELVIRTAEDGTLTKLRDVGRAELGAENYGSLLRFMASDRVSRRGVGLGIQQQIGSNALDVANAVRAEIETLSASFPPGVKYDIAFDTTRFIEAGTREVITSLLLAIVLVIVIIYLFLQNWRSALIASIAIPVALVGTFIFIKLLDFSINTLTLFGLTLATGLVVDDAIVIVEDITRRIQEEGMQPVAAAIASMDDLLGAVIATSIVLVTVFVPVAFLPGTAGQLYQQFALTIACAITVSTFNAITLTPTLSALLLRQGQTPNHWFFNAINGLINRARQTYGVSVAYITRHRSLVLAGFAVALVLTYGLYNFVPRAFLPEEDQGYFITIVQGPEGVSLNYTESVLQQAEAILKEESEIQNIFAVGGFSFSGSTPNNGIIFSTLKPWDQRPGPQGSAAAVIERLFPKLMGIQEATVIPFAPPAINGVGSIGGFEFYLQDRVGLGFEVMGQTLGEFMGRASTYPTPQNPVLQRLRPNFSANTPQISVTVDRAKASALQVSIADIFDTLRIFLGSTYVNDFNQFQRTYRVYVQADQAFRSNPEDIRQLYVRSQTGQMIPLSSLVSVTQTSGPSIINHYNLSRAIEINGAAAPGQSSGQAIAAMEAVARETLPRGFGFEWSGLSLEEIESGSQGVIVFALGIVFVFLTLAAQYESYVDPLIIMLTVPLAMLGALLALVLRGIANDVYTQIGFVMLIGIASKNAILIVEFANQQRDRGMKIIPAVIEAAKERLRPILMTALSTVIGAMPLFFATGPGAAARQSLGTAIVGGMCIATILSLFVAPVLYIVIKSAESRLRPPSPPPDSQNGTGDGLESEDWVAATRPASEAVATQRRTL
ncbi:efflux RND transporter permease subunit [Lyngbya confervoides]|uniref:Efflux RND transporter permease subunit n=1 Tax=Lyngbya confervoides BDU141951 TaxID=1574623 RepID=A0ABD4T0I4_9CYAN|nr:efflux RND transporter permease subunit [Lyngbya confervoides]MCM1981943.1 efflux RND transporter permease subunit [Lyngbya confervoides BDU141951]